MTEPSAQGGARDLFAAHDVENLDSHLNDFTEKIVDRFKQYVVSVSLLPPADGDGVPVMVLVDDSDSERMSKQELSERLQGVMGSVAEGVEPSMEPRVVLLSWLWEDCYDGNYELLHEATSSATVYDTGMLQALKAASAHKNMVLERFEKYIVSYVLAGSLVQGKATPESDIDVFLVIDDTDVKKMSRAELKDKLRAIITGMGSEAAEAMGVKGKLNVQVYILTDFWENIKQANPVIFTFLRDGVPLYDRGIFMAWKQLLQMGRIKPSPEAIDMFMNTGEQMMKKVDKKLKEIGMEDFFWAAITTSQAALMLYGLPPPTPKETPETLKELFVDKEGFLEDEDVETVREVLQTRKDLEHGTKQRITGEEIDDLREKTQRYLDKSSDLFESVQQLKNDERFENTVEDLRGAAETALRAEGKTLEEFEGVSTAIEEVLVHDGQLPQSVLREVNRVEEALDAYEEGGLSKAEMNEVIRSGSMVARSMHEHAQRVKARDAQRSSVVFSADGVRGEVTFTEDDVFVAAFEDNERGNYVVRSGSLEEVSPEDVEGILSGPRRSPRIDASLRSALEEVFGEVVFEL